MILLFAALLIGGIGGVGTGGRLSHLGRLGLSWWPLLLAAIVVQSGLGHVQVEFRWVLALADCAAIVAWCARNVGNSGRYAGAGLGLIALGVIANALAIAANAGMPVSPSALSAAGLSHMNVARGHFYKHVLMTSHTHLHVLGDTIPLRLVRTVASPGDMLMLIGITTVVWAATKVTETGRVRLAQLATQTASPPPALG